MGFCDRLGTLRQGKVECSVEVQLEQADTSDTACIQKFPVMFCKQRFFDNGHLSLQSPQHTTEDLTVIFIDEIIAREMHIHASTSKLSVHLAEGSHLIRSHQHMTHTGHIFNGLEMIKIVLKTAATACLCQMVSLIHNDGKRLSLQERFLHRFSQLSCSDRCSSTVHKRVSELSEHRFVVINPVEPPRSRFGSGNTRKRNETLVMLHLCFRPCKQTLFEQVNEGRFTHTRRPNDEHHCPWSAPTSSFSW